jgi:methylase of polypeptide subunit release factors
MQTSPFKARVGIKQLEQELIAKAKSCAEEKLSICGLKLFIPKTVFNTAIFLCETHRIIAHISIKPGKSFLDLGCGCRLYAILAAKSGCYPVYATDINQDAIHATEINAKTNNISVTIIKSDIFHDVPKKHKFDIIWWHHPYNLELSENDTDPYLENLVDQDYRLLKNVLSEAPKYLEENGRIYLPNSREIGCRELFLQRVHEAALTAKLVASEATVGGASVDIFELHN